MRRKPIPLGIPIRGSDRKVTMEINTPIKNLLPDTEEE